MLDFSLVNLWNESTKDELDVKSRFGQENVGQINSVIKRCQREYDRLSDLLYKGEIVEKVSSAVGALSAISLLPSEIQPEVPSLVSTPAGKVVLVAAIGGFAVAGISNRLNALISNRIEENLLEEEAFQEELVTEKNALAAAENARAINELRSVLYGDEAIFTDESKVGISGMESGNTTKLPRIVVVDERDPFPNFDAKDFYDLSMIQGEDPFQ